MKVKVSRGARAAAFRSEYERNKLAGKIGTTEEWKCRAETAEARVKELEAERDLGMEEILNLRDDCDKLHDVNATLRALLVKAGEALGPFGEAADEWGDDGAASGDEQHVWPTFTIGDFRRANRVRTAITDALGAEHD